MEVPVGPKDYSWEALKKLAQSNVLLKMLFSVQADNNLHRRHYDAPYMSDEHMLRAMVIELAEMNERIRHQLMQRALIEPVMIVAQKVEKGEINMSIVQGLPVYQSHKRVKAARILTIEQQRLIDRHAFIYRLTLDKPRLVVQMPEEWFKKHNPEAGGYFVQYEDGHQSYSPAKVFEEGYTLLEKYAK